MSFAGGRRRGNGAKKGVQFTVMVVGQLLVVTVLRVKSGSFSSAMFCMLQVLPVLDEPHSLTPCVNQKSSPTKLQTTLRLLMLKKALESSL
jgi:hypothetical protein